MYDKKINLSTCPVCHDHLIATKLACEKCDISFKGTFSLGSAGFEQFSPEQRYFIITFLKCRGNIKEVERELGISYPTVRNRLDEILKIFGFPTEKEEKEKSAPVSATVSAREIIEQLDKGAINTEEALKLLKNI